MGISSIPISRVASIALIVAAAVLSGCGGGGGASETGSGDGDASGARTIAIRDFAFQPADISVPAGTTVEIDNRDETPHTVTAKGGAFDSGPVAASGHATLTLDKPGTYSYYCAFHPFMKGTIEVE